MTYNLEVLRKRFGEIEQNLTLLEQAANLPLSDFLNLPDKVEATMFRLLICIEAAQAVCTHVAPRVSSQTPDSAAHCFECLAQAGVYEDDLARRLAAMSRFRNLLVHRYWGLDPKVVHSFLPQSLRDLRLYIAAVSKQVSPP
jgi:uncharacterized protein YutE (UPF0331/DUF86 family)